MRSVPALGLHLLIFLLVVRKTDGHWEGEDVSCADNDGNLGSCLFTWECRLRQGTLLSACRRGYLVGACCQFQNAPSTPPKLVSSSLQSSSTVSSSSSQPSTKITTTTKIASHNQTTAQHHFANECSPKCANDTTAVTSSSLNSPSTTTTTSLSSPVRDQDVRDYHYSLGSLGRPPSSSWNVVGTIVNNLQTPFQKPTVAEVGSSHEKKEFERHHTPTTSFTSSVHLMTSSLPSSDANTIPSWLTDIPKVPFLIHSSPPGELGTSEAHYSVSLQDRYPITYPGASTYLSKPTIVTRLPVLQSPASQRPETLYPDYLRPYYKWRTTTNPSAVKESTTTRVDKIALGLRETTAASITWSVVTTSSLSVIPPTMEYSSTPRKDMFWHVTRRPSNVTRPTLRPTIVLTTTPESKTPYRPWYLPQRYRPSVQFPTKPPPFLSNKFYNKTAYVPIPYRTTTKPSYKITTTSVPPVLQQSWWKPIEDYAIINTTTTSTSTTSTTTTVLPTTTVFHTSFYPSKYVFTVPPTHTVRPTTQRPIRPKTKPTTRIKVTQQTFRPTKRPSIQRRPVVTTRPATTRRPHTPVETAVKAHDYKRGKDN